MTGILSLLLIPVLIPINFYSGDASNKGMIVLVTDGSSVADIGLYRFSISNATDYLRESQSNASDRPAWRKSEAVQLRTVIVQNVPPELRTDFKLKQWFENLKIGEVQSARLDSTGDHYRVLQKLLNRRARTLRKLERSYMKLRPTLKPKIRRRSSYNELDTVASQALASVGVQPNDSIVYYTNKLSRLTQQIKKARSNAWEGIEAYSWLEMKTMEHYFFYLIFNVLLIFTLSSTIWTVLGTILLYPGFIFTLLASTLPSGATFFINYIIINIMLFALELVRPVIFLYLLFKKWAHKTPRELYELNMETSYLNFGILYPAHLLVFIIVLCYSVIAPLILIPGTIYFAVGFLVYKNQLLYVYVKEWESYGRHWVMGFKRIIIGLLIFQSTMSGFFITKKAPFSAIISMALVPLTIIFYSHCQYAFNRRTKHVPLDQLLDSKVAPDLLSPRVDRAKTPDDDVDPAVVISAEEYQQERYPLSYDNPILAKPLPRPWLPVSIAGWWTLLPKYDSDGEEEPHNDSGSDGKGEGATSLKPLDKVTKSAAVSTEELTNASAGKQAAKAKGSKTRRGTMSKGVFVVAVKEEEGFSGLIGTNDIQLTTEVVSDP
ncbi:CSC1-like protein erd4 [Phlyctochytrium bullatum]|nr:CSC1-like protein erd4 [Phlyctochytrium bullatum]